MRRLVAAGVVLGLMAGAVAVADEVADERDRQLAVALEKLSEPGASLEGVRIELTGGENRDPYDLAVYGSGVGVWNRSRQFELDPALVRQALGRLREAGFAKLPERVIGPSPTPTPTPAPGAGPHATIVLRSISVTVGNLSKTVHQDNKAWPSPNFAALHGDLVAIFREPGRQGVTPKDLADAIAKLRSGVLRPEVLQLTANAPEQRGLESQEGQGWLLRIRNGRIEAQAHQLGAGYGPLVSRPLSEEGAQRVASWLAEAKLPELPRNIDRKGYLDLAVTVLSHDHTLQARPFAGRDPAAEAQAQKALDQLRARLETLCRETLEPTRGGHDDESGQAPSAGL